MTISNAAGVTILFIVSSAMPVSREKPNIDGITTKSEDIEVYISSKMEILVSVYDILHLLLYPWFECGANTSSWMCL